MFLWGFLAEESAMSDPVKYEYEHTRKEPAPGDELGEHHDHGSYTPWKPKARDRLEHLDTDRVRVGDRVELQVGTPRHRTANGTFQCCSLVPNVSRGE